MTKTAFLFLIAILSITLTSCKSDSNSSTPTTAPTLPSETPDITKSEELPYTFQAIVEHSGQTHTIDLTKFSIRQKNAKFFTYNADISEALVELPYTPEVRSYRGYIKGQPTSMIIGYVNGDNTFYGRVFYGGVKSWEIKDVPVKTKKTTEKLLHSLLNRSPNDLKLLSSKHVLPEPSLSSPIPDNVDFYLQRADMIFFASQGSYDAFFNKNIKSAIGGMDYAANLFDYIYSRDALIRFSYAGGLITQKEGTLTESEQTQQIREKLKDSFSIFHKFTGPANGGANTGLSSYCPYDVSLWCALHELGHAFNLGHDIGPETTGLMATQELIPTNVISVIKSSGGATQGTITPALESRMSPNANIDHLDVNRNGQQEINVLDNDYDANGPLKGGKISLDSVELYSLNRGKIENLGNGNLRYTPPKGFVGDDHFHYTIQDDSGMKDKTEVHVKVISDSHVAYLKKDHKVNRTGLKSEDNKPVVVAQAKNLGGKESFLSLFSDPNYPNLGFTQQVLVEGPYDTVYEENNTMALRDYMSHDLAPGKSSFSVSLTFQQDGDFLSYRDDGTLNRGSQEIGLVGQGKLDDGFALSYFNGNKHRQVIANEPAKGLGWTLIGRQHFTQQNFSQRPHEVHAFASPDAVMLTDNKPHQITWVINREKNTVTTYVDNIIIPMVLDNDLTTTYQHVPLPKDFGGVYPGGTHYWYSSGRDFYTESYGPWFMRMVGSNQMNIWHDSTDFIAKKLEVDNIHLLSYALNEQQVSDFYNQHIPAYSNTPLNGELHPFSDALELQWKNEDAKEYKLTWGYEPHLATSEFSAVVDLTTSKTITPNSYKEVIYWRVDTHFEDKLVKGHIWSIRNQDTSGSLLSVSFTNDELSNSSAIDSSEWPKNTQTIINDIDITVSNQTIENGHSVLILKGESAQIQFSSKSGRSIKQANLSIGAYDHKLNGQLSVEYSTGSEWISALVLHKNGVPTGQNYNGEFTTTKGIAVKGRTGPKDWYKPNVVDDLSTYVVNFPENVSELRVIVRGASDVAAIIDHITIL